jgi:hypothetical protein
MHRTVYELLTQPRAWQQDYLVFQDMKMDSHAISSMMWCQLVPMAFDERSAINSALNHLYIGYTSGLSPEATLGCLSRFQALSRNVQKDHAWGITKRYLLHDNACPKCWDDSSVTLALAIEMGFINAVKFAIENASLFDKSFPQATNSMSHCTCRSRNFVPGCSLGNTEYNLPCKPALQTRHPLLYHAVCKPLLRDINSRLSLGPFNKDTLPSLDMVRYILQLDGRLKEKLRDLGKKNSDELTVWTRRIRGDPEVPRHLHRSMVSSIMEITKLLLDANAATQEPNAATLHKLLDEADAIRGRLEDYVR